MGFHSLYLGLIFSVGGRVENPLNIWFVFHTENLTRKKVRGGVMATADFCTESLVAGGESGEGEAMVEAVHHVVVNGVRVNRSTMSSHFVNPRA